MKPLHAVFPNPLNCILFLCVVAQFQFELLLAVVDFVSLYARTNKTNNLLA